MIKNIKNPQLIFLVLLILSSAIATRFYSIENPKEVVFDEVHYIGHVNGYITGEHTFSGHPPLGIMLIALAARIGGYDGNTSSKNINDPVEDALALRFLPALVGSLIPLAVFILALLLGAGNLVAFLCAMLLVFDNAFLVQSKLALIDVFLIFFGLIGLICFLIAKKYKYSEIWLALSGIFLALSISVKWSAIGFIIVPLVMMSWNFLKSIIQGKYYDTFAYFRKTSIWLVVIPIFVYISVYMAHVSLITKPGPGDAFVSAQFQSEGVLNKVYELNKANYDTNLMMTATHPYSSKFYTWPLLERPIYYWVKNMSPGTDARIYLLGNPIIWWGSTVGLLLALFFWKPERRETKWILYGIYLSTILPFIFVSRVTFIYHYLPSLIFAVIITVMWLFQSLETFKNKKLIICSSLMLIAVILIFFYFVPLSYGTPLSANEYNNRVLINSWR